MNQEAVVTACRHRWLIDSPNGPVSQGKCISCGEHGEFRNSMPISGWDREGAKSHRAKQART
ncbi:MAG: hypothetical protein FJ319_13025 [SAR202 cluster bacterium]|nr:hypothetical protein [SAR202 cluster bacterium]